MPARPPANESFIPSLTHRSIDRGGPGHSMKSIVRAMVADGKTQKVTLRPRSRTAGKPGLLAGEMANPHGQAWPTTGRVTSMQTTWRYRTAAGQDKNRKYRLDGPREPGGHLRRSSSRRRSRSRRRPGPLGPQARPKSDATANFVDSSDTYLLDARRSRTLTPSVPTLDQRSVRRRPGGQAVPGAHAEQHQRDARSTTLTAATVTIVYNPLPDAPAASARPGRSSPNSALVVVVRGTRRNPTAATPSPSTR